MENQQIEIKFSSGAIAHWRHLAVTAKGQVHQLLIGSVVVAEYLKTPTGKFKIKPWVPVYMVGMDINAASTLDAQAKCAAIAQTYHDALMEVVK